MKKNDDEKKLSLLFIGAFFIFAFFIIFAHKANASSDADYFPIINNKNGHFSTQLIENLNTRFDSENNYVIVYYANYNPNQGYGRHNYYYIVWSKDSQGGFFGEKYNNLYQFSFYTLGDFTYTQGSFWIDNALPNTIQGVTSNNLPGSWFEGLYSSNYNTSIDYVTNYRVLTNNTSSAQVVIWFEYPPEYSDPDNDTYPNNYGQPQLSEYYNQDNAPLFDNSSTTNAIESIYNILKWFFSGDGIGGIINFLVDNTNWGLQKVINNIKNVLQNVSTEIQEVVNDFSDTVSGFLSDIQDTVSDIHDKLADLYDGFMDFADLFIHPFDEEEYEEQIAECELIEQYNTLIENCEVIQEIFDNATERDHFSLYIDFENPFADSEHKIIHSEINFDWLVPLRSVYRPFLWVFTLFECFVGGMRVLGNIIGGKAK